MTDTAETAHGSDMKEPAEQSDAPPARALYQLRVEGPIPADLVRVLGGLKISVEPAETVLSGTLPDQAALFGLLVRIHGLGLQLLEVRRVSDTEATSKG
jgi:hypothetical protein